MAGTAIGNPTSASLTVPQNTDGVLAAVVSQLGTIPVGRPDRDALQDAIALLTKTQRISGHDRDALLQKIADASEAVEQLGLVRTADVTGPRLSVAQIVAAWERAVSRIDRGEHGDGPDGHHEDGDR
jgi:hypothetical protein